MKLIIYLIFFILIYQLIKRVFKSFGVIQQSKAEEALGNDVMESVMLRCPVCNVYFARKDGVALVKNNITYHFCGEKCKTEFTAAGK